MYLLASSIGLERWSIYIRSTLQLQSTHTKNVDCNFLTINVIYYKGPITSYLSDDIITFSEGLETREKAFKFSVTTVHIEYIVVWYSCAFILNALQSAALPSDKPLPDPVSHLNPLIRRINEQTKQIENAQRNRSIWLPFFCFLQIDTIHLNNYHTQCTQNKLGKFAKGKLGELML